MRHGGKSEKATNTLFGLPYTQKYKQLSQTPIGVGAYGEVHKACLASKPSKLVAIKHIFSKRESMGIQTDAYREINILSELRHPNIIRLEDVILLSGSHKKQLVDPPKEIKAGDRDIFLVYDYAEINLMRVIRDKNVKKLCPPPIIKNIMFQLLQGVDYLHKNWVMHRDIKPANILIKGKDSEDELGRVKIADFGLARIFQSPLRKLSDDGDVVTIWYRAPELLLGAQHYTRAIDMWAVGCIFGELWCSTALFPGQDSKDKFQEDQLRRIFEILGKIKEMDWPDVKGCRYFDKIAPWRPTEFKSSLTKKIPLLAEPKNKKALNLLRKMLHYDPTKRITAHEALQDPYFSELPRPFVPNAFKVSETDDRSKDYLTKTYSKKPSMPVRSVAPTASRRPSQLQQQQRQQLPHPMAQSLGKRRMEQESYQARGGPQARLG